MPPFALPFDVNGSCRRSNCLPGAPRDLHQGWRPITYSWMPLPRIHSLRSFVAHLAPRSVKGSDTPVDRSLLHLVHKSGKQLGASSDYSNERRSSAIQTLSFLWRPMKPKILGWSGLSLPCIPGSIDHQLRIVYDFLSISLYYFISLVCER